MYAERDQLDSERQCSSLGRAKEADVAGVSGTMMKATRPTWGAASWNISTHLLAIAVSKTGNPGKISARMRHICGEATADGIADEHEYDRYGLCFLLHDLGYKIGTGHDYVWRHADQLFGKGPCLVGIGPGPTGIDPDIAPFGPTQFLKPLPECQSAGLPFGVGFAISQQQTDSPHPLRLLRASC